MSEFIDLDVVKATIAPEALPDFPEVTKEDMHFAVRKALAPESLMETFTKGGCQFPFNVVKSVNTIGSLFTVKPNVLVSIVGYGVGEDPSETTFVGVTDYAVYTSLRSDVKAWRLV